MGPLLLQQDLERVNLRIPCDGEWDNASLELPSTKRSAVQGHLKSNLPMREYQLI